MANLLHIETLTGKPTINGVEVPYPNNTVGLLPVWEPAHIVKRMYDGSTKIKERRWRAVFTLGWRGLTEAEYEIILDAIEETSFEFVPRTQKAGETATPNTYNVFCRSIIRADSPIRITGGGYDIDVELVSRSTTRERGGTLWTRVAPRLVKSYSKIFAPVVAATNTNLEPTIVRSFSRIFAPVVEGTAPEPVNLQPSLVQSFSRVFSPTLTEGLGPIEASNPLFWLHARDLELVEDDPVITWTDRISNIPFNIEEGTVRYRAAGINGLPAVEFFAGERFNANQLTGWQNDFTHTVVIIGHDIASRTQRSTWMSTGVTSAESRGCIEFQSGQFRSRYGDDTNVRVARGGTVSNNTVYVLTCRKRVDEALPDFYINGTLQTSVNVSGTAISAAGSNQNPRIGSVGINGGSTKFDGLKSEVIVWQRALTDQEISDIHDKLLADYI